MKMHFFFQNSFKLSDVNKTSKSHTIIFLSSNKRTLFLGTLCLLKPRSAQFSLLSSLDSDLMSEDFDHVRLLGYYSAP